MRMANCAFWGAILTLAVFGLDGLGQDIEVCRQYHPWGEFQPGAWKLVRVFTETLDEDGLVTGTSTSETRTTLLQMDDRGITLEVATTVEVAGKRFEAESQTVDQGFWGQTETQTLRPGKVSPTRITVGEQTVACQVRELEIIGSSTRTTSKVFFSADVQPHVLRRESVTTTLDGNEKLGETTIEVIALDMPFRVLSEIQPSAHVRSVNRHPKGVVFTLAVTSGTVPGGVVSHWSKEMDRTGRIVRRSTLELIDYGLEGGQVRTGLFGRPRPRRGLRPPNP
ncbi:MAG: hypothetical protein RBS80_12235 [Thermoguttaceae bacterium]|nr:hypothetical protein [Thermoguttaceae bacterium]